MKVESGPEAIELFRSLDLSQVWLLDVSDASEAIYLASPAECAAHDRDAVEADLMRLLGIKVYFGPLRQGVHGTLVYLRANDPTS